MTLVEYRIEVELQIEAFHEYYHEHAKQLPLAYPLEMEAGDWDEQFAAFLETVYTQ